jgi:hypothetical protein
MEYWVFESKDVSSVFRTAGLAENTPIIKSSLDSLISKILLFGAKNWTVKNKNLIGDLSAGSHLSTAEAVARQTTTPKQSL